MSHLRLANGAGGALGASRNNPLQLLCYIFIDWGGCKSPDECGFDIGGCPGGDICVVDY